MPASLLASLFQPERGKGGVLDARLQLFSRSMVQLRIELRASWAVVSHEHANPEIFPATFGPRSRSIPNTSTDIFPPLSSFGKFHDASEDGLKSDSQNVDNRLTDTVGTKRRGKEYWKAFGGENQRRLVEYKTLQSRETPGVEEVGGRAPKRLQCHSSCIDNCAVESQRVTE